jgi:hypothetical protein
LAKSTPHHSWAVLAYLIVSLGLVAAITGVAMLWVHLSHLHVDNDNDVLLKLWGTHGVHRFDIAVLAVELVLVTLLTGVLIAGFTRRR